MKDVNSEDAERRCKDNSRAEEEEEEEEILSFSFVTDLIEMNDEALLLLLLI